MAFKENVRLEQIYFANLKKTIKALDGWKQTETGAELSDVLNSCIESNEAILLLYKNVGECWNDLASMIAADRAKLEELSAVVSSEKDEINAKIDDVNNYLVNRISLLENRVEEIENRVEDIEEVFEEATFTKFIDLEPASAEDLTFTMADGKTHSAYLTFEDVVNYISAGYNVVLRGDGSRALPVHATLSYADVTTEAVFTGTIMDRSDGSLWGYLFTLNNSDPLHVYGTSHLLVDNR